MGVSKQKILDVVKAVSYEMSVPKEVIFQAMEAALELATKKQSFTNIDVRVAIDRETGDYQTYRRWTVVDEKDETLEFDPNIHKPLHEAQAEDPSKKLGDLIEKPIESVDFFGKGRIAAQLAKQIILQKVREAKRAEVVEAYRGKVGQLITGVVKKSGKEGILLDLGDNAEAIISREEMLSGETVRIGDRLRAYLYEVRPTMKGPQVYASRARREMMIELFRIEVPEIGEQTIEIKSVAREPGVRSKVAVKTHDGRIDPIGACVGMRGARVQAISNELHGERVDVILWDDNPAQLVINALAPAEIASIVMDEDARVMDVAVEESQLAQAIGRNGQNVRLASELTGWKLNVMTVEEAKQKSEGEVDRIKKLFIEKLNAGEEVAEILVREGLTSLEEIAYVPLQELSSIEEFDEELLKELRNRAREVLAEEEQTAKPSLDLLTMKGMTEEMAYKLASHGIKTMETLAEQSVDELLEIEGITDSQARELIMTAREPWFKS